MSKLEVKGILKGIGIACIVCAAIFYSMIMNIRTDYEMALTDDEVIIEKARDLGMIYITEVNDIDFLTKEYIVRMARSYGMEYIEGEPKE